MALGLRDNQSLHRLTFPYMLDVKGKGIHTIVYLDIIPCKDRHSRNVKIEGKLIISKSCSRYKWLVQYCIAVMTVEIFSPANNTELFSINKEYDITEYCDSELIQDHQTDIELDTLDHESIIYNFSDDITEYLFKITVQLIEKVQTMLQHAP